MLDLWDVHLFVSYLLWRVQQPICTYHLRKCASYAIFLCVQGMHRNPKSLVHHKDKHTVPQCGCVLYRPVIDNVCNLRMVILWPVGHVCLVLGQESHQG